MTLTQITKIRGPGIHTTSNIVSHNINSSGIITAVAFKGPFTGSSDIQSGILTATKIDLNGDIDVDGHTELDNVNISGLTTAALLNVSNLTNGRVTYAAASGRLVDSANLTFNGSNLTVGGNVNAVDGAFSGNVSIGGTLTYEDVTNIDSVGIITARDGLKVLAGGANVVGVVTATTFKGDGDFVELDVDGHTNLDNVSVGGATTISDNLKVTANVEVGLDLDVDGHTNLDNVSIAGVVTATTFKGDGDFVELDVDGHTNLDNVSIAGVVTATSFVGAVTGAVTGTASGNPTLANGANNRVVTATGANALTGESNFTFDGSKISITGSQNSYLSNNILWFDRAGYSYIDQLNDNGSLVFRVTSGYTNVLRLDNNAQAIFGGNLLIPDAIQHVGDLDCKIRFPGTDTISFETASNERLRINSTGNVSIGDNPTVHADYILHVEDSGETNVKVEGSTSTLGARISLQNNNTTANSYSQYSFNDAGGQSTSAIQGINTDQTNNYGELTFLTRNAQGTPPEERMRITKDGYIQFTGASDLRVTIGSQGTAGTNTANWLRGSGVNLMYNSASGAHRWEVGGAQKLELTSGGNLNVGGNYTQTTYTMRVTGSFAATTKSFVIDHPTKENHKLRYACLEGPENSVYVRGRSSDSVIELPDYWVGLVHDDSITVNVTPIGNKKVWVESINNNSVTIGSDDSTEYFYTVFAERKDVEKLEVEVEK